MGTEDINFCENCLTLRREIDDLKEEIASLKAIVRRFEKMATEGYFGKSTPSSQIPLKANTPKEKKPKGKKPGSKGFGRKSHEDANDEITVSCEIDHCPDCGELLENKGSKDRSMVV